MKDNSYIIIELMVRQMIKKYKNDPKRSVRNIVDMALNFSKGRFQRIFFEAAQKMLNNSSSAYYELIDNVLMDVDTDRLIKFGMNIGYNSCTKGAEIIRQIEASENFDIPWSLTLEIDEHGDSEYLDDYIKLIEQGKDLGIYTWELDLHCRPHKILNAIAEHSECAFVLIVSPEFVTEELLLELSPLYNIMLCVRFNEGIEEACRKIHERKMLCSLYLEYNEISVDRVLNSKTLQHAELMKPVFCIFDSYKECDTAVQERAAKSISNLRKAQQYSLALWENKYDTMMIDTVISDDPCSAYFDADGGFHSRFHSYSNQNADIDFNFRSSPLKYILGKAFYKSE